MTSSKYTIPIGIVFFGVLLLLRPGALAGYELFIYRPLDNKLSLAAKKRVHVQGELFGQFLSPSTFPSFNDLSGRVDRWNIGFHNYLFLTPSTMIHAQLVTHDNGADRTKFDWHFSLHQAWGKCLRLYFGHDSDHDSDHISRVQGKAFFNNRNYLGVGFPYGNKGFIVEPFIWFFHHTNQRLYLDLSGDKLKQEAGLRFGVRPSPGLSLSCQVFFQSDAVFSLGQALVLDLVLRQRLAEWLEISAGTSLWRDRVASPSGNQKSFYKFSWGIAVPF